MTNGVIVLDASAAVDLVVGHPTIDWISEQLMDNHVVVPMHFHAEALNAIGGMLRGSRITAAEADRAVGTITRFPVETRDVAGLLQGAWRRRGQHALLDAIYVELAARLDTVVVTTDRRLARATTYAVAPPE